MSGNEREEGGVFELALVLPKWGEDKGEDSNDAADCVEILAEELRRKGLIVERVSGLENEFIKVFSEFYYFLPRTRYPFVFILSMFSGLILLFIICFPSRNFFMFS